MTADQIRPPEEVPQLTQAFQDQSPSYRHRLWLHRKKNGELIHVEIVSFNLTFDGRLARLGVVTDITERVKAEERSRQTGGRALSLLKSGNGA